jgi:hypothetical protein
VVVGVRGVPLADMLDANPDDTGSSYQCNDNCRQLILVHLHFLRIYYVNMQTPEVIGTTGAGRKLKHTAKALKRVLKAHGLKTSGKKATLTRRAKKAHLLSKV